MYNVSVYHNNNYDWDAWQKPLSDIVGEVISHQASEAVSVCQYVTRN